MAREVNVIMEWEIHEFPWYHAGANLRFALDPVKSWEFCGVCGTGWIYSSPSLETKALLITAQQESGVALESL